MVVKYCPRCPGKPYTDNLAANQCPQCGSVLSIESADDFSLSDRTRLIEKETAPPNELPGNNPPAENVPAVPDPDVSSPVTVPTHPQPAAAKRRSGSSSCRIVGKVSQYSCTGKEDGKYRRLLIMKMFDALVYHQRLEDVLHRFNVRVDDGRDAMGFAQSSDIPVNVHGTIAGGMNITDNAEVEVEGKYRNGVLIASRVSLINNGFHSQIKFQRSIPAIIGCILAAIAALIMIGFAIDAGGSFLANVKVFLLTWLVVSVAVSALYFLLCFTKLGILMRLSSERRRKLPVIGILLLSLIITMFVLILFR